MASALCQLTTSHGEYSNKTGEGKVASGFKKLSQGISKKLIRSLAFVDTICCEIHLIISHFKFLFFILEMKC